MLMLFGLGLFIFWLVSLICYDFKDGGCVPSKDECSHCPFPCDKRKK